MVRPASALPLLAAIGLVAGCRPEPRLGTIEVSAIGAPLTEKAADADRQPLDPAQAALVEATGQGLVRYDANGQIVAGLAERWIVGDNGRSLIFRLPDLPTPGVKPIEAAAVARRLRAAIAASSRNPLKPLLGAVDEIDPVTPQVIDIGLKSPRPNLIQLLAQPDLALGKGESGPFAQEALAKGVATLRPLPVPQADPDRPTPPPQRVRLRGERAGVAVARFAAGRVDLVLGGSFNDLAVARAASLSHDTLHVDPTHGLFGFAFATAETGFLSSADNRRALSMSIDRERIGQALGLPGWTPSATIVAANTPEIEHPAQPDWDGGGIYGRQSEARATVARWRATGEDIPPLRIALPAGPGARILFARIAADWRELGIEARMVGPDDPADLRLIDQVAPADVASFYLRAFACDRKVPCTDLSDRLLIDARDAAEPAERAVLLTQADAVIAQNAPFIALGPPFRWSLVSRALDLYRDNARAIHPLNELRSPSVR
jgi:oligopeptide transport system substrate-binding protein